MSVPGILIGSNGPTQLDRAAIAVRLADPRVGERCGRAGINVARMVDEYLRRRPSTGRTSLARRSARSTRTCRRDEFDLGLQRR